MAIFGKLSNFLTPHTEQRIKEGKLTFVELFKDSRLNYPKRDLGMSKDKRPIIHQMVIVRHPFERLLSAYRDQLERRIGRDFYHRKYGYQIVSRFRYANQFNYTALELLPETKQFRSVLSKVLGKLFRPERSYVMAISSVFLNGLRLTTISLAALFFLSEFRDSGKMSNLTSEELIAAAIGTNPIVYRPPTFKEFVDYLLRVDPRTMDEHWRPMYLDCHPCYHHFDLILKVETMETDKEAVFKLLGYNRDEDKNNGSLLELNQIWNRWANKALVPLSSHTNLSSDYFSKISRANLRLLYKVYEPDFILFNYTADKYFSMSDPK